MEYLGVVDNHVANMVETFKAAAGDVAKLDVLVKLLEHGHSESALLEAKQLVLTARHEYKDTRFDEQFSREVDCQTFERLRKLGRLDCFLDYVPEVD